MTKAELGKTVNRAVLRSKIRVQSNIEIYHFWCSLVNILHKSIFPACIIFILSETIPLIFLVV